MKKIFFFLFSLLFFYSSAFADSNLDVNLSVDVDSNLDYVDNWVWVNIWQPLNYKLNFCNTSWNDLEFIMFRLYSTMWSNLEFVSNSLYLESISLPDWVFNSDMSVWNLTNWSCKNLFFALKPKQWWTLKTNDNVDYIAKYKYWVMATYLDSNTIWNPVSSVPVSMTISWPNSWTWSTQNITANINEWVVFYTLLDVWNNTCDNSVTFENTYTWTLSFDNEADNWKKACFKWDNWFWDITYSLSNELKLDTNPPLVTIHNPPDIYSNSQIFSFDFSDDNWWEMRYILINNDDICNEDYWMNNMFSMNIYTSYSAIGWWNLEFLFDWNSTYRWEWYSYEGVQYYYIYNTNDNYIGEKIIFNNEIYN